MIHKEIKTLYLFLIWVFGFFVLLSFDLFIEGIVFEWLKWNGTTKNDWFFALWWGLVVVWFIYGSVVLYKKLKTKKMSRNYTIQRKILRPVAEVFEAIISSDQLQCYFVDSTSRTENEAYEVLVIFEFEEQPDSTILSISERGWKTDTEGLKGSHDNCGGWTHMTMCLKAYMEHGIDMR